MNILILGNIGDMQSGIYILEACKPFCVKATAIDVRQMKQHIPEKQLQKSILKEVNKMTIVPNLIIVMKGLEMTFDTLKKIKKKFPKAKIVNWFFDVYLGKKKIWEREDFFKIIKFYDYFFCSLKGVADKLKEKGLDNVRYLDEGCSLNYHSPQYMNFFQKNKYGEDVSFVGTLGLFLQHPTRVKILEKVLKEGFNLKIWGFMIDNKKKLPISIRHAHQRKPVINDKHSMVAQSSLVNLSIDQDIHVSMGHSARLYRIMCAGGLVLSTATSGLEHMFKTNLKDEEITEDQELVLFFDENDLVRKLDFLLEHEEIRKKIAKNGMKKVQKFHTFEKRIKEMLEVIKK
jgi:spore maturation protein CgeB